MNEKVYEMYDDYYHAEAQLQELIEARNLLKESLKTAHPDRFAEMWIMLNGANQKIDQCRAVLKAEYDAHQKTCRAQEKADAAMQGLMEGFYGSLVYMKHRHPESFKQAESEITGNMTSLEIKEFYEGIANLEATRLEEFIAEKEAAE